MRTKEGRAVLSRVYMTLKGRTNMKILMMFLVAGVTGYLWSIGSAATDRDTAIIAKLDGVVASARYSDAKLKAHADITERQIKIASKQVLAAVAEVEKVTLVEANNIRQAFREADLARANPSADEAKKYTSLAASAKHAADKVRTYESWVAQLLIKRSSPVGFKLASKLLAEERMTPMEGLDVGHFQGLSSDILTRIRIKSPAAAKYIQRASTDHEATFFHTRTFKSGGQNATMCLAPEVFRGQVLHVAPFLGGASGCATTLASTRYHDLNWIKSLVMMELLYQWDARVGLSKSDSPLIVDVGLEFGYETLLAAAHGYRTISVELSPFLAASTLLASRANGFAHRTQVINAAASNQTGVSRVVDRTSTSDTSGSQILANIRAKKNEKVLTVASVAVGDLPGPAETVFLLKLDCEGHDFAALQGAKTLFDEGRILFLSIELFPYLLMQSRVTANDFCDLVLQQLSLECFLETTGASFHTENCLGIWNDMLEVQKTISRGERPKAAGGHHDNLWCSRDKRLLSELQSLGKHEGVFD